ncbi:hypothetical protein EJ05DRAFT_143468 [Pseudovirgaria hyperparasitica]|uniref:Uncharacterized protein n=1 Tax=Pseudovirgaria hyperparasitica TaxID=470096 RepID=A0A6A6VW86_9PEZI|nr:uncharacterized protein EJ05DRAFT_143468 [Pseudovirgaria hyperparasitica]KAF2754503.1 hypothetical protein EJ05DRAFT_143468 [Pseudovirgaria hyperparasitica]
MTHGRNASKIYRTSCSRRWSIYPGKMSREISLPHRSLTFLSHYVNMVILFSVQVILPLINVTGTVEPRPIPLYATAEYMVIVADDSKTLCFSSAIIKDRLSRSPTLLLPSWDA